MFKVLCVHIFFISLGYIARNKNNALCGNSVFNVLEDCKAVFQSEFLSSGMKVLVSPHPNQHVSNYIIIIIIIIDILVDVK